jgi:abortive infection bacteriophage resistance protein
MRTRAGALFSGAALRMKFTKPALSLPAQVAKLQSRGLAIPDAAAAEHYLRFIGYYRFADPAAMGFPVAWKQEAFWGLTPP